MKNRNLANIDNAYVASNVGKKNINDIIVNQVMEELYSRFNIVVNKDLDDVYVNSPKTKFVKGECSYCKYSHIDWLISWTNRMLGFNLLG